MCFCFARLRLVYPCCHYFWIGFIVPSLFPNDYIHAMANEEMNKVIITNKQTVVT